MHYRLKACGRAHQRQLVQEARRREQDDAVQVVRPALPRAHDRVDQQAGAAQAVRDHTQPVRLGNAAGRLPAAARAAQPPPAARNFPAWLSEVCLVMIPGQCMSGGCLVPAQRSWHAALQQRKAG
jgi:hypothetical protein